MTSALSPVFIDRIETAVEHVLATVAGPIVLGIPLGVGKPNPFVNALYRRIKAQPERQLTILTALSLEKPVGHSELERHFLEPFVARVFGDYPDLDYVKDSRADRLPPNIKVLEFFMKTGDYLQNAVAQQHYISTNYTFVARDMALQGMNVLAQAVGMREDGGAMKLSLSSNPDVTFEMMEHLKGDLGQPLLTIGVVNDRMPFMPNTAEVDAGFFDVVVTDPAATHDVFAPPNMKVSPQDYGIGLHAASLVLDGGTLQIGIGSLGDAIAQALILRDRRNADFRRVLGALCPNGLAGRELGRFDEGLYGCSEMFVNGFLKLIEAGIIRREVFDDAPLQRLLNSGRISTAVDAGSLVALHQAGRIGSPLSADDVGFLKRHGILQAGVELQGDSLQLGTTRVANDVHADGIAALLGARLTGCVVMHGGFFLGPRDFYERLRSMPREELAKIDMTRVDFINQLYGHGPLAREQRRRARFMNTTMIVTLLGAAVSDALDNGAVVSGVGGQYNFVAMGHALKDARSILMLRATHAHKEGVKSSIVWNYANTTIPRHLRDMVITEYGVADVRGQPDSEVVKRLVAIADSRFQNELMIEAKRHGKLEVDYILPERYRHNTPEALVATLAPWRDAGLLPDYPFGTDMTEDELAIVGALHKMKQVIAHPVELIGMAFRSLVGDKQAPAAYLERLGLDEANDLKTMLLRRLFAGNL